MFTKITNSANVVDGQQAEVIVPGTRLDNTNILTVRKAVEDNDEDCSHKNLVPRKLFRHGAIQNVGPVLSGEDLSTCIDSVSNR
jgi:hypothetical protein